MLSPGQTIDFGRREIGQKPGASSGEDKHFSLQNDRNGLWIRNIAQIRRLSLEYQSFETSAERFEIVPGHTSRIYVDGATVTFRNVTDTGFDLDVEMPKRPLRRFHYSNARPDLGLVKRADEELSGECVDLTVLQRLQTGLRHLVTSQLGFFFRSNSEADIAVLGGQYNCQEPNRRQIGGIGRLPWRTLKIIRQGQVIRNGVVVPNSTQIFVTPFDANRRHKDPVSFASWQGAQDEPKNANRFGGFADIGWQVDAGRHGRLERIVVGRTTYDVALKRQPKGSIEVTLRPVRLVPLVGLDDCQTDAASEQCPFPLNTGQTSACEDNKCWTWSSTRNALAEASGSIAVAGSPTGLSGRERLARIAAIGLAIVISGFLSGGLLLAASRVWTLLSGQARKWPHRSLGPVLVTAASGVLTLAPEIANYLGTPLSATTAMQFMIGNWLLAGIVLLWGGAGVVLGLMWIAVIMLFAMGSNNLASMATEGDNTRWVQFFIKHKYLFLDMVPPFVVAFATCPQRALRRNLQIFVLGEARWSWLVRLLPPVTLAGVFLLWLFVGSQTGFGVFQPVEAGKFASVFLAATALMIFDGRVRARWASRSLVPSVLSFLALMTFALILLIVPGLRSDWSPIVIMVGVLAGLMAAFGIFTWIRKVQEGIDRQHGRQRVPVAFKPSFRRWWYIRKSPMATPAVIIIALGLWAGFGNPVATSIALVTGAGHWPGATEDRLRVLETDAFGAGRRVVVERLLAWVDMSYGNADREDCSIGVSKTRNPDEPPELARRSCYVDIELQVIRSRRSIAQGQCGISDALDDGPVGVTRAVRAAGTAIAMLTTPVMFFMSSAPFCGATPPPSADPDKEEQEDRRPIRIPVVEKDFAAAYLIGQFGVGAGFLFYAAQVLLIAVVVFGFVQVSTTRSIGVVDEAVRRFVAIVMAGAALLLILQWSLSWSNVLGLLPVMGQPMTMLAYATSHHLFVALPCILVFIVALRYSVFEPYRYHPRDVPQKDRSGLGIVVRCFGRERIGAAGSLGGGA